MSIRARLLLLVLFATLLPTFLAAGHFLADRDDALKVAQRAISTIAVNAATDLNDKIRGTNQLLYGLAQARSMDSDDRDVCSQFLVNVLAEYPQYTGILTIQNDASLFCDSLHSGRVLNLSDRTYYQKAVKQQSGVALEPVFGRLTGTAVLQIAHPARSERGALRFVFLASLNLEKYMQDVSRSPAFPSLIFLLVDRDGMILTRHPSVPGSAGTSLAHTQLFEFARTLPDGGIGEERQFTGRATVWTTARLSANYDAGLSILVGASKDDLAAAADMNLIYTMTILALLTLTVLLGAWTLAEVSIRRQVARIITMANRLATGDLKARIQPPHPRGELGSLIGALNNTAETLDSHRQRIEELNLRLTALIKSSPAAIVCFDPEGNVTLWNAAAEQTFGYNADEALGKPPLFMSDEERPDFAQLIYKSNRGTVINDGQATAKTKDGRTIHITFRSAPMHSSDGRQHEVVFMISDATEKLVLEQRLRQAQKMEAIGQLTGGVAHDFNNLLTVILGNSELLTELLTNNPDAQSLAVMTTKAATRGAELTNSLLAFARKQALTPQIVNVNAMLTQMNELLRRALGEHIQISLVQAPGLWPAMIDPAQMESAVLNLAVNARDAMPGGGHLTIETVNVTFDADYALHNTDVSAGKYVMIAVSDTGTGMSPDVLAHVFEPFFTTKDVGEGSGLGLSMVYGFVKQSGGQVKIHSELGLGTTFKLYLPSAEGPVVEVTPAPYTKNMPRGSEHILTVEDDEMVRAHVDRQLTALGYRVTTARDAAEALASLRESGTIDLLFTDVVMPGGMNGPALAREARKLRPRLKTLFTSGYTEDAMIKDGSNVAGISLLSKPYRMRELATKIRETLDDAKV